MHKILSLLGLATMLSFSLSQCSLFQSDSTSSSQDSSISTSLDSTSSASDSTATSITSTISSSSSTSISEDLDRTITKLAIPKQSGSYIIPGTTKTIYEDQYYIKKQDVMAYVIAFKKMPSNYYSASSRSTCVSQLGSNCMLYGSSVFQNKEGLLDPNYTYREMDLYVNDQSYTEAGQNRGQIRLVYSVGNYDYTKDAVYYTDSHYKDFSEYLNYVGVNGDAMGKSWYGSFSYYPQQKVGDYIIIKDGTTEYMITLTETVQINSKQSYFLLPERKYSY